MIEYIIAHNPDDRILHRASEILKNDELVCIPTDTSWVFVACSTKKNAVEKLYKIKKEGTQKHFSLLCNEISMASDLAVISNHAFKLLKKCIPGHYTFIFEATKKISKLIQASKTDKEVGIRFVPSVLVSKLIEIHGEALVSTNLPASMITGHESDSTPVFSYQFEDNISAFTELIIDPGEIEFSGASTIIDFVNDEVPIIVREGSGDTSLFS